ncbi:MAG: DUF5680 domain-containing protein [Gaiellaceae bacterium]
MWNQAELEQFVVAAKAAAYAGDGAAAPSCRRGSHDLAHTDGRWSYLDSYFGGADFLGQEIVWHAGEPVWAMNYHGAVLDPERIDAARAGAAVKEALSALYRERRFLGGFRLETPHGVYVDTNSGDVARFDGEEWIEQDGVRVYGLRYHGGLVVE